MRETGLRKSNSFPGENLETSQLVARADDGYGLVSREGSHHFELTNHGGPVKSVGGPDAGDDAIKFQGFLAKENLQLPAGDIHGAAEVIQNLDFVAPPLSGLNQPSRGIGLRSPRENANAHQDFLTGLGNSQDRPGSTRKRLAIACRPKSMG